MGKKPKRRNGLVTLFLGQEHAKPINNLRPAIENQHRIIRYVWASRHYKDFGIERVIRYSLACILLYTPSLHFKARFDRHGVRGRKLAIDAYVLVKTLLPMLFLCLGWTSYWPVALVSLLLGIETMIYLAALIFLSEEFARPISYRRSVTALFLNYIEISLDYAVIYAWCNTNILGFFKCPGLKSGLEAAYFSFATSATVGYGDIVPTHWVGQLLVISQILTFLVFVGLFINTYASRIQEHTYHNSQLQYDEQGKWRKSVGGK